MTAALPYLDADTVTRLVPVSHAIQVLENALRAGLDPETTPPRSHVDLAGGQLLMMPAGGPAYAGVKIVSVAPDNPRRGLPRIQGTYLLFDRDTLAPLAVLDGVALTSLRTPAVSAVAVRHLASPDARRLTVFGTGPQAWAHITAIRAVRPIEHVTLIGRDVARAEALAHHCRALGLTVEAGYGGAVSSNLTTWPTEPLLPAPSPEGPAAGPVDGPPGDRERPKVGSPGNRVWPLDEPRPTTPIRRPTRPTGREVTPARAVAEADIVACCTTSRNPLFPGKLARDGVTVVAVGSHEPDAREVDDDLVARSTVVVEALVAALAEAGDVIVPVRNGTITTGHLAGNLADLVAGRVVAGPGPRLFKSVGMAWEDLVVAAAAYEAWR
ncbi:ornithine cyclodeaminase family protein [Nonomuraea sp. NPDC050310]|uniref:ornithine cyclodeaminase family protein n=1 Tax=Nonomuraea sp. NPDC050310 TaxID=3154935 RepID=UPI0033E05DFC